MNPNNPIKCDLETVITAQITIIDRDAEISDHMDLVAHADNLKAVIKNYFENRTDDCKLDDEHIKVKLFVHEKGNGGDRE